MLRHLLTATRVVGLSYKILSGTLLCGLLIHEAFKYAKRESGK